MTRKFGTVGLGLLITAVLLAPIVYLPQTGAMDMYSLEIEVVGEGTTDPPPGTHSYERGSMVLVRAEPAEGYVFYQWEIDGRRVGRDSPLIEVEMNGDHVLRALFVEESLTAPLKGIGPEVSDGAGTGGAAVVAVRGFPEEYRVVARDVDLSFSGDLLEHFGNGNRSLFLGGPAAMPFAWGEYGVSFSGCSLWVEGLGERLDATFGVRDYAVILLEADGIVRIAGITRYGTRAGLIWMLREYDLMAGRRLIVVEWMDLDGDGSVEYWEISPVLER